MQISRTGQSSDSDPHHMSICFCLWEFQSTQARSHCIFI